jgi:hypothetical protein
MTRIGDPGARQPDAKTLRTSRLPLLERGPGSKAVSGRTAMQEL